LTFEVGAGAYWIAGPLPGAEAGEDGAARGVDAMGVWPVEATGERGSPAGAPHAAQNFREPMSSVPHFAQ
jgi:hypothetical protein